MSEALRALGAPAKARASAWFFKTGAGQYGHGHVFLGVTVREQRKIAKRHQALPLGEIETVLESEAHECRLTVLLIIVRHTRPAAKRRGRAARASISGTSGA